MSVEAPTVEVQTNQTAQVVRPLAQIATFYGALAELRATPDYNLHSSGSTTD